MAIIGKIREKSTLVLIIIGGAIVAFVLSDLFSSSAGGPQGPVNIAEVNGKMISPQEFDRRVQTAYDNYEQQAQQELDERTRSSIREQIWNDMLAEELLGEQMKELGVNVTTKELFGMVQGNDPHPQVRQAFTDPETGQFNSAAVVQFLQNLDNDPKVKQQWIAFEQGLKKEQRRTKYGNLVKKGLYVPSALATQEYGDNNTKISFKYVYKPYSSIADSTISLTEAEIKDHYKKNIGDYEQKASRKVAYAYFPVSYSPADLESTQEWANQTFAKFQKAENDSTFVNANSDVRFDPTYYSKANAPVGVDTNLWSKEVGYYSSPFIIDGTFFMRKVRNIKMAPDSVKASHILINAQERTPERAEEIADSLLNLLNAGTAMADIVVENSDDVASAQEGGDVGWFAEGMMVKPFSDAAFSMNVGEFRKVQSQFGFHIIEVTDQTEQKKKIQIATIQRIILPSKDTYADVFNKANSFSIEATDQASFDELINSGNIQRRMAVLSENDNVIPNLPASRDFVRWAKDSDEGSISEAYDVDDAFVVGLLESVDKEGAAPLDKVRNRVEYLARQDKKAAILKEEMKGASSIGELASSKGLSVESATNVTFASPAITGVGLEPKVVGKAVSLSKGQMSVPIQGNNGVFVVSIDEKAAVGEANIAQVRASQKRSMDTRVDNGAVFNALKDKAELTDNRAKFY